MKEQLDWSRNRSEKNKNIFVLCCVCCETERGNRRIREYIRPGQGISIFVNIYQIQSRNGETAITGGYLNEQLKITIPFIDKASVENAIHFVSECQRVSGKK